MAGPTAPCLPLLPLTRGGLGLVAEDEVGVGEHGVQLRAEELAEEGRGEVEGVDLARLRLECAAEESRGGKRGGGEG